MRRRTVLGMAVAAIAILLWLGSSGRAQTPQAPAPAQPRSPVFVAIYERGPAWDDAKGAFVQTGIQEHVQFLRANAANLVGAAPFQQGISVGGTDHTVGMVVVMAASQEEAQALISADPAIAGNLMKATVRRWLVDRMKAY